MLVQEPTNIFVFIHGMRTERDPVKAEVFEETYRKFWERLCKAQPGFREQFNNKYVGVQWGHANVGDDLKRHVDRRLTEAQRFVNSRVDYSQVKADKDPNNQLIGDFESLIVEFPRIPFARGVILATKEEVMIRGLGDAVYYCSMDGELQVRKTIYEQILNALEGLEEKTDVRLHIFAHSLGVTVSHDFLFGLFAPEEEFEPKPNEVDPTSSSVEAQRPETGVKEPDFLKQKQGSPEADSLYRTWRRKARAGHLKLGTLISAASQLPLFVMRKQSLVDRLSDIKLPEEKRLLDPSVIGISSDEEGIKWVLFYDADDPLGFPTRRLYYPRNRLQEIQVSTGNLPPDSHAKYWENDTVIQQTARLVTANSQAESK